MKNLSRTIQKVPQYGLGIRVLTVSGMSLALKCSASLGRYGAGRCKPNTELESWGAGKDRQEVWYCQGLKTEDGEAYGIGTVSNDGEG